jgi:hypothetical protein
MIVTEDGIAIRVHLSDSATNAEQIIVVIDGQCNLSLSSDRARTLASAIIQGVHRAEVKAKLRQSSE